MIDDSSKGSPKNQVPTKQKCHPTFETPDDTFGNRRGLPPRIVAFFFLR